MLRLRIPIQAVIRRTIILVVAFSVLFCISGIPAYSASQSPFSEIPHNHWSYRAVEQLFLAGMVTNQPESFYRFDYAVSRYEMAVWVASAINTLGKEGTPTGAVKKNDANRVFDIKNLVDQYNAIHKAKPINASNVTALSQLITFLADELASMGYIFAAIQQEQGVVTRVPTISSTDKLLSFSIAGNGTLQVGATNEESISNPKGLGYWGVSSRLENGVKYELPVGLGLTLELGDLLLSASRETATDGTVHGAATLLGLKYRLPKVNIQVGYTSEVGPVTSLDSVGSRRTTSAGVEYTLAPASKAGAALTLSDDSIRKTTTTDFGLRFEQQDASVMLGYKLIDLAETVVPGQVDSHNNVATAEFSIRF